MPSRSIPVTSAFLACLLLLASSPVATLAFADADLDISDDLYDASFYDRKAPNEKADAYSKDVRREQVKRSVYGDDQYKEDLSRHGMGNHVVKMDPKEEQMLILEQELNTIRDGELIAQSNRVNTAQVSRDAVKRQMGWFPSASESARLQRLDDEVGKQRMSLEVVKQKEQALMNRLKPLYGLVSWHFVADQQVAIRNSMSAIAEAGYNNAWYSTLFSLSEAESLGEVLMTFAGQFLVALLVMYPFALLYFALWSTPWNIYYYSSSIVDVIPAIGMYFTSILIMALPFLALTGGLYIFIKVYGGAIAEQAQERANQAAARRALLLQQHNRQGGNFTGAGAPNHQQGNVPFQDDVRRRNVPPAGAF